MQKIVIVTGASSGIGLACVERYLHQNAVVVACDISPPTEAVAMHWRQRQVCFLQFDVQDDAAVTHAVECVADEYARIDVLVNCAGIAGWGALTDIDSDQWHRVLGINLTGTMRMCREVLPVMLSQDGGCIVNVASIFGLEASDNNVAYNVSKGGVVQLTRSLAADYASRGIRSNGVAPGLIETAMTRVVSENAAIRDQFVSWHLQGRPGRAEEVAAVVDFLSSEDASFVNGQVIAVDGGFSAGRKFAPHSE